MVSKGFIIHYAINSVFMVQMQICTDTGWIPLGDNSRYRKKNGIVYIVFQVDIEASGWTDIFVLPPDYAPTGQYFFVLSENATDPKNFVNGYVRGSGNVTMICPKTGQYLGSVSYPV